ncbi:MAG: hypothetical protein LIO53_02930 [Oscillospiraceae bacterium]|nr:hypothetical protein [Oscillospiraceae bacterium]
MNLRQFEGKKVCVITQDDKAFTGLVNEYVFPEDNYPEEVESIILITPQSPYPMELKAYEIAEIEIIE